MGRLDAKVAVITGGARGMGAEEAQLFAAEGATVVLADVLDTDGQATAAKIDQASYHHLDVRAEDQWQAIVDQVMADHGRIDVLVNNAGVDLVKKLLATTIEDFERVTDINLRGTFLGMRTVADAMIKAELPCSIVNVSSVAGLQGVRVGETRYSSQLDSSRHHRDTYDGRHAILHRPRGTSTRRTDHPVASHGPGQRHRQHGAVPCQRRLRLLQRSGLHRRRWRASLTWFL